MYPHFSYREQRVEQKIRGMDAFHGTDDQLEQYVLGQLSDSDLPPLEEHLLLCVACQEKVNSIEDFAIGMREALRDPQLLAATEPSAGRSRWFAMPVFDWLKRPAFAMALSFAALVVMAGVFLHGHVGLAPVASLQLTALRGDMPFVVQAREFDLTLADAPRDGGPFRVEVLNSMGVSMWSGMADSAPAGVQLKLMKPLLPGDYFVRLYSASGTMMHEYGFRIRR